VDQFADIDETGELAEGTLQQCASGAAGSGDIDDDRRLPGRAAGNARLAGASVRCSSLGPGQRGHDGHPHVGFRALVPLEELYCASRPVWRESWYIVLERNNWLFLNGK